MKQLNEQKIIIISLYLIFRWIGGSCRSLSIAIFGASNKENEQQHQAFGTRWRLLTQYHFSFDFFHNIASVTQHLYVQLVLAASFSC